MNKKFYGIMLLIVTFFMTMSLLADSPRKAMVEEGTNTGCGPCATYNPNFQKWIFENLDVLVPTIYHPHWPSSQDPFYVNDPTMNDGRVVNYYHINGVPEAELNGQTMSISNPFGTNLNTIRNSTSPLTITLEEEVVGNNSTVTVTVHSSQAISGKKLRIVVNEYHISYNAPNGERDFYWVARKMLPDYNGLDFSILANETKEFVETYTIKSSWQKSQLYIAAFIQDDNTREVLQAEHTLKTLSTPMSIDDKYLALDASSTLTKKVTVTNPSNSSLQVKLAVETAESSIPTNWEVKLSDYNVTVPANGTKDVTLTIKSDAQAGFAFVSLSAEPIASNVIVIKNILSVYALSNATKYALYVGGNNKVAYLYNAIKGNSKYGSKTAALPLTKDVITHYNPNDKFDLAVLSFDQPHRSALTNTSTGYSTDLANSLRQMVTNGKKVFITGELELYNSGQSYADPQGRAFLNTTLGITYNGNPKIRVTVDGNGYLTGISKFNAKGMNGDPISNGLDMTLNDYSNLQSDPYIIFTDIIQATDQKAVPFLYYDNTQSNIGGVRIENGKSKAVYLSFGVEAIKDVTQRNNFVGKILDWLFAGGSSTIGPVIEFSSTNLDFDEVKVSNNKIMNLSFTNNGDEDLIISELNFDYDYDPDSVFAFVSAPSLPMTITPGNTSTIEIQFTPKDIATYDGLLTVKSNSISDNVQIIDLSGKGIASQGAIISAKSMTLDFGQVAVNDGKVGDVVIYNTGTEDLNISEISFENNTDNAFSIVVGGESGTIPVESDRTITIKFTPPSEGQYSANLVVKSNAVNEANFKVALVGNGFPSGVPEEVTSKDGAITLKATPNPMGSQGVITYSLKNASTGSFNMYLVDLNGRVVKNLVSASVSAGTHTYDFNTSSLSSGTYVIVAQRNGSTVKLPMIINK